MSASASTTEHPRAPGGVDVSQLVVGVLGGTGPQGRGLAVRLAAAGQRILLGSRDADKCASIASEVAGRATADTGRSDVSVTGGSNADVAGAADLVIVAVPFSGHAATLAVNAPQVEALTVNLVSVNRGHKVHPGVRITDV